MAKWLGLPVILVVDARSMARSAAALVQGFTNFDPAVAFAGVVFNRLGSRRHLGLLCAALEDAVQVPCLGGLLRTEAIAIPERHLGLVTSEEHPLDAAAVGRLADGTEQAIDVDHLLSRLPEITAPKAAAAAGATRPVGPVRIGVARDPAFCFYYPDNLELLEESGAQLLFFSPTQDASTPPDLDGIYIGGGYPELFAGQLAANASMRRHIQDHSRAGMPIYAECGGFMYLGRELQDLEGRRFPMVGCFPFHARMLPRLKALGYREVRLTRPTILGDGGAVMRGHEFHYSEMLPVPPAAEAVYHVAGRDGTQVTTEGHLLRRTLGSYIHLHFGSAPQTAAALVAACAAYRTERNRNA
jgi:cobyrinic acid a,c-diamide synthase